MESTGLARFSLTTLTSIALLLAGCGMNPLAPQNPLVGKWRSPDGSYTVEFLTTGNCSATLRMNGALVGGPCTYTSTKDEVTLKYNGGAPSGGAASTAVWKYSLAGDNLTISYGLVSIALKRVH